MKTFSMGAVPTGERTQEISCNLCGTQERKLYLTCEGFSFYRCRSCGLVYQHPQPVFEDLKKRYGDAYFDYELTNDENFFNLMRLGLGDIGFFDIPDEEWGDRSFLDVGCATGLLVKHMQDRGWKSEGVEICRESAEYGIRNRGVKISLGTLEEQSYPSESFAVVHFSHVIEHVPDPKGMLAEVRRILRKDGMAVITTPNVLGFQARLFGKDWRSAIADHLTLFSKATLGRMFDQAGLRVKRIVTWGGIAAGTAPNWIKRPVDRAAKRLGFGDVMLFQAVPEDL
jgi:2-polyprenyl-3-methyl-5-hydroxy-6-metoxy-1,4-benzoquinol methylase